MAPLAFCLRLLLWPLTFPFVAIAVVLARREEKQLARGFGKLLEVGKADPFAFDLVAQITALADEARCGARWYERVERVAPALGRSGGLQAAAARKREGAEGLERALRTDRAHRALSFTQYRRLMLSCVPPGRHRRNSSGRTNTRTRGSRRVASRSAGGGSSGDPDSDEPAGGRRRADLNTEGVR